MFALVFVSILLSSILAVSNIQKSESQKTNSQQSETSEGECKRFKKELDDINKEKERLEQKRKDLYRELSEANSVHDQKLAEEIRHDLATLNHEVWNLLGQEALIQSSAAPCFAREAAAKAVSSHESKNSTKQISQIPTWVKQNAEWWADDVISDQDFTNAIGYLVEKQLIDAQLNLDKFGPGKYDESAVVLGYAHGAEIPGWVKQNAEWWADGAISDSDFTSAIEYMIKEDIISFSEKHAMESDLLLKARHILVDEAARVNLQSFQPGAHYGEPTISSGGYLPMDTFGSDVVRVNYEQAIEVLQKNLTAQEYKKLMKYVESKMPPYDEDHLSLADLQKLSIERAEILVDSIYSVRDSVSDIPVTQYPWPDLPNDDLPNDSLPNQLVPPSWDDYELVEPTITVDENQIVVQWKAKSEPSDTTKKNPVKKTDQEKTKTVQKKDSAKPKPKTTNVEYDSQTLTGLYKAIKWAEYSQTLLLDAINQYNKELKTQIKQDEQEYATTKYKALMDAVIEDKNTIKKNDIDLKNLIGLEEKLRDYESEIRKEASKKRILPADLNKAAEEPINKMEILPPETIGGKLKEAKKALGKLDSVVGDIVNTGGVDPDKFRDDHIPESMKDLPGLGDGAIQLKVLKKSGLYEGNTCNNEKINGYFHWTLMDEKENTPKVPMYMILEAWKNGKKLNDFMLENHFGSELSVSSGYDPDATLGKNEYDSIVQKAKDKVHDSFKGHFVTYDESSEQVYTFKIVKVGPAYSGYVYSGDGDQITIKIPACPKKPTNKQAPQEEKTERKYGIDSVVDDLVTETVDPFSGLIREKRPKIINDVHAIDKTLHEILDTVEKAMEKEKKSSVTSQPEKPTQPPVQPNPQTEQTEVGQEPPVQPNPQTEQQTGVGTNQLYFVQVFAINGKDYPVYQFVSSPPDNCDSYHYHATGGKAYALDGMILNDPAPSSCGFGKTNSMGFASAGVFKNQILVWESLTGINIPEDD